MQICSNCGKNIVDGSRFCANCGTAVKPVESSDSAAQKESQLEIRFACPHCGTELVGDSKEAGTTYSCLNCGKDVQVPLKPPKTIQNSNFPEGADRATPTSFVGRRGRCKYCGNIIAVGVNPCPHCGHELKWVRRSVLPTESGPTRSSALEANRQTETVELSQDLSQLAAWGGHNALARFFDSIFPFAGVLVGLLLFLFNPLWIVTGAIFCIQGTERLKKGDIDGARRSLFNGRFANWMMIFTGIVAWTAFFHFAQPGRMIYRMLLEPKVEVVQSATGSTAAKPASPSIRAEMRQALTGGHVLQVWNATHKPVTCTATLNNPELRSSPTYRFTVDPGAQKPKELGIKQFGHRIKKKPRCSVTIEVEETGEVYKFTP